MLSLKQLPYKTKLIAIYISTTLLGIVLTLISIFNASHEQLILDHINNVHAIFSDQLSVSENGINTDLSASRFSTEKFKVFSLPDFTEQKITFRSCELNLSRQIMESQRMNKQGGVVQAEQCMISWVIVNSEKAGVPFLVLSRFNESKIDSIISAYRNRLIIPLVFFVWIVVWGSLILGNLITRLQTQKDEVEHMAMHDSLTGLANRKNFSEKISELIAYSSRKNLPFMLAMVDLNKFKNVNDDLGHQYGDILLQQVANRFMDDVRDYDVVARFGGDEFVLLLMNADMDSNMKILQRIYMSIIKEYNLLEHKVSIGASIGVSYFPQHDTTYSELVHKADLAMYIAKESGGGVTVFDPYMFSARDKAIPC